MVKFILKLLQAKNRFSDLKNTYVITGMPRGGTTWMAEVFNTLPNSLYLHEPLKKGRIKGFEDINFDWHQFIPENAIWPEAVTLFRQLFSGRILNPALIERTGNIEHLLGTQKLVLKFVRLNRMLPWIADNFPELQPSIYIIRHPCAVIYSQMNHGAWDYVNQLEFPYKWKAPSTKFSEFYEVIQKRLPKVRSIEQHLAIAWCLDSMPLFHRYNNKKWITISYEEAVLGREDIIREIFERLDLTVSEQTLQKLNKPSSSTQSINPLEYSSMKQISKWQNQLSRKKLEEINEVLNVFEIDFYTVNDVEPDYAKVHSNNHNSLFSDMYKGDNIPR